VRYLVAGLGNIGQRRRALLGARCVATADPFNTAADYRTVRDCPPERYDAAVLAIPDDDKVDLIGYLLEQGKHVLVEKPLPLPDAATARRLEALARERGVALYTAYNHRFEPLLVTLREQLQAGAIGEIYHGRLFYGNGTVRHVAGTWRDQGLGAITDLGCHLLDLLAFSGAVDVDTAPDVRLVAAQAVETQAPDRAVITTADGRFTLEVMYHAWRNSFAFELYGHNGSLHCHGLRKWGGSELTVRARVFPSGKPTETHWTDEGPDVTWEREVEHFERLCAPHISAPGGSDRRTDWWIAQGMHALAAALAAQQQEHP
jgi:scyllo-inositol 2-dehydrogenase (NADP+)